MEAFMRLAYAQALLDCKLGKRNSSIDRQVNRFLLLTIQNSQAMLMFECKVKEMRTIVLDNKLLPRVDDLIFKAIFADPKHQNILRGFLQSVLDIPKEEYDCLEIIDPHSRLNCMNDKESILDIKLKTKSKKIIDIEMQVQTTSILKSRVIYYTANMLHEQLKIGDDYGRLKKVISILIVAKHPLIKEDDKYWHKYLLYDKQANSTFSDLLEIHTLELRKLPANSDGSNLWKWMEFFKTESKEELEMLAESDAALKKAVFKFKELSYDEAFRLQLEARDKFRQDQLARERDREEMGLKKGRAEGLQEGIEKGIKKTALSMLADDMPVSTISKYTGLS
ncbi:MAG: Rpn family recombination-promoting nuclease/putative transposase, partial [Streptococcaceae bacterium]|nr:Rpn family recombination-promoting nuclease/putative transposase [Streptococcaceae bacterium]